MGSSYFLLPLQAPDDASGGGHCVKNGKKKALHDGISLDVPIQSLLTKVPLYCGIDFQVFRMGMMASVGTKYVPYACELTMCYSFQRYTLTMFGRSM